ncbi:MAG: hypothetical protein LIO46_05815 [Clostridiales bacterium]|nr:hypothetical protein [Clostridiales bacterium]
MIGFLVIAIADGWAVFMPMIRYGPLEQIRVKVIKIEEGFAGRLHLPTYFATFELPDSSTRTSDVGNQYYKK